jgi:hypothetical protein
MMWTEESHQRMTTTNALVTRWRRLPSRRVPPSSSIPREDDRMSHAYFSDGTSAFFVELAEPVFVPCSACSRLHHAWPHAADPRALSMMSGCEPAVAPHPFSPRLEAWKKAAAACAPFCVSVFLVGLGVCPCDATGTYNITIIYVQMSVILL